MEENRTVWKILPSCVKPTPESILGDVPDLNVTQAILPFDAENRSKWKKLSLQAAAYLIGGTAYIRRLDLSVIQF